MQEEKNDSQLEIFNYITNETMFKIRSFVDINYNIWFIGNDIAKCLGYIKENNAINKFVGDEDKITFSEFRKINNIQIDINPKQIIINESGFYSLTFSSKLESAVKFKRWVTSEVLPSIRKKGYFTISEENKAIKAENLDLKSLALSLHEAIVNLNETNQKIVKQNMMLIKTVKKLKSQNNTIEQKLDDLKIDVVDNSKNSNLREQFLIIKLYDEYKENQYQYYKIRAQKRSVTTLLKKLKTDYNILDIDNKIIMRINYIPNSVMFSNKLRDLIENIYIKSYGNYFNVINNHSIDELKNKIYEINEERFN